MVIDSPATLGPARCGRQQGHTPLYRATARRRLAVLASDNPTFGCGPEDRRRPDAARSGADVGQDGVSLALRRSAAPASRPPERFLGPAPTAILCSSAHTNPC
jgi:hypothetical protein